MVNAGIDEKLAMKIGGWKTDSVFRRYRITPRKDLHRAADKMNEFFRAEDAALRKEDTINPILGAPQNAKRPVNKMILMVPGAGLEPALALRRKGF